MSVFSEQEFEKIKEVYDDIYGDDVTRAELELLELRMDFADMCAFLPEADALKLKEIVHGLTQLIHGKHDRPCFPTCWPSGMDLLMFSKNHPSAFSHIRDGRCLVRMLFEPIRRARTFLEELYAMIDSVVDVAEAEVAKQLASEAKSAC